MAQDAPRATEIKYSVEFLEVGLAQCLVSPHTGTVVGSPDQSLNVHSVSEPVWGIRVPLFSF